MKMLFVEALAEAFGWLIITVLRLEFGCEISDAEAKSEVRKLRQAVRSAVEQGRYDQVGLPAEICQLKVNEVITLQQ